MLSHIWTVIARHSVVDASSNNLSLHNILEKIDVDIEGKVPENSNLILPIDFELVSLWSDEVITAKREFEIKVEFVNTEKKVIGEFPQLITFEKGIRRFRSILKISGLPITKSGIYFFRIYAKSKTDNKFSKPSAQIPLEVNINIHPNQIPAQS